jgi:hypothetical protein
MIELSCMIINFSPAIWVVVLHTILSSPAEKTPPK